MKGLHSTISDALLHDLIDQIVGADRVIAPVAIADGAGGDVKKISKAKDELAKGDSDAANDKADSAIEHYRNAWSQTLKS
jgi:hypothetical protein